MNIRLISLLSVLYSFVSPVNALELPLGSEIHGFFSQSYLVSPDNPYAGTNSEDGSFKFREIGINGFSEFSPEFRIAGQALSRYRDKSDDGEVRIDFLLADYLFFSDQYSSVGVRLGRVKNKIGLYNDTRDIPSARPGFNVPESVYFEAFRDALLSTDGMNLYGTSLVNNNLIQWELTVGRKDIDSEDFEYYTFARPVPSADSAEVPLKLFSISVIPAFDRDLKLGLSLADVRVDLEGTLSVTEAQQALVTAPPNDLAVNPQNYVTAAGIDGLLTIASAQYNYQDLVLAAEYLNLESDFDAALAGNRFSESSSTEAYYLQVEWFTTAQTSVFTRYEELYLKRSDRSGADSATGYNPYRGFGRGWTLGGKWSVGQGWSISGQASFNEGTAWLPNFEGIENHNIKKHWNYYVFSVNYQF
jgi:hypothetical protein